MNINIKKKTHTQMHAHNQTINFKNKFIDFNHDTKRFSVCLIWYLNGKYQFIILLGKIDFQHTPKKTDEKATS